MSVKALRFYNLKTIEVIWIINFWVQHSLYYRLSIGYPFYTINISKKSSLAFVSSSLEEVSSKKEFQWELWYRCKGQCLKFSRNMFRLVWSSRNDVFYVFVLVIIFFLKVAEPLKLVFSEINLSNRVVFSAHCRDMTTLTSYRSGPIYWMREPEAHAWSFSEAALLGVSTCDFPASLGITMPIRL